MCEYYGYKEAPDRYCDSCGGVMTGIKSIIARTVCKDCGGKGLNVIAYYTINGKKKKRVLNKNRSKLSETNVPL